MACHWPWFYCLKFLKAYVRGFPDGTSGKEPHLPMQETQETCIQSLGLEDCMANHCNIFAWKIPWTEEPGRLQFIGSKRVEHNWSDLACTWEAFVWQVWERRVEMGAGVVLGSGECQEGAETSKPQEMYQSKILTFWDTMAINAYILRSMSPRGTITRSQYELVKCFKF